LPIVGLFPCFSRTGRTQKHKQTIVAVFTRMQFIARHLPLTPWNYVLSKTWLQNGQQTFHKIILCTLFKVYVHICCSSCTIKRSWHRTLQGTEPFLLTLHLGTAASNYLHCGDG